MVHLDVKKVGRIPDGGGWRVHGRNSDQARAAEPRQSHSQEDRQSAATSTCTPRSTATPASPTPSTCPMRKPPPRSDSWPAPGSGSPPTASPRSHRVVTDNGSCYRSNDFARSSSRHASRHQRIRPYTPRHNGKVERYQRILAEEVLYARDLHQRGRTARPRSRSGTSTTTTIDPTPPPETNHPPADSTPASPTSCSYT